MNLFKIDNNLVPEALELYNQLIEGYELALELETDEEKIKMYMRLNLWRKNKSM